MLTVARTQTSPHGRAVLATTSPGRRRSTVVATSSLGRRHTAVMTALAPNSRTGHRAPSRATAIVVRRIGCVINWLLDNLQVLFALHVIGTQGIVDRSRIMVLALIVAIAANRWARFVNGSCRPLRCLALFGSGDVLGAEVSHAEIEVIIARHLLCHEIWDGQLLLPWVFPLAPRRATTF